MVWIPSAIITSTPRLSFKGPHCQESVPARRSKRWNESVERNPPSQFSFEWTQLTYQKVTAGNTAVFIFPLCVVFVFLALAAEYENWSLPLAVILIVPMCLLSAMAGVYFRENNNIFTQIGFIVLVGLTCKNAILIVEFARQEMLSGKGGSRLPQKLPACVCGQS
jgi:multidrug efflux pump subunit AcrB